MHILSNTFIYAFYSVHYIPWNFIVIDQHWHHSFGYLNFTWVRKLLLGQRKLAPCIWSDESHFHLFQVDRVHMWRSHEDMNLSCHQCILQADSDSNDMVCSDEFTRNTWDTRICLYRCYIHRSLGDLYIHHIF